MILTRLALRRMIHRCQRVASLKRLNEWAVHTHEARQCWAVLKRWSGKQWIADNENYERSMMPKRQYLQVCYRRGLGRLVMWAAKRRLRSKLYTLAMNFRLSWQGPYVLWQWGNRVKRGKELQTLSRIQLLKKGMKVLKRYLTKRHALQDCNEIALRHWGYRAFLIFCGWIKLKSEGRVSLNDKIRYSGCRKVRKAMVAWVAYVEDRRRGHTVMEAALDLYDATHRVRAMSKLRIFLYQRQWMAVAQRSFSERRCLWVLRYWAMRKNHMRRHQQLIKEALWSTWGPYSRNFIRWRCFSMVRASVIMICKAEFYC